MFDTYDNTGKIIDGVLYTIKFKSKVHYEFDLIPEARKKIRDFLENQSVVGGVRVVFTSSIPEGKLFSHLKIENGELDIELNYGKNNRKDKFPNILFVSIFKNQKIKFQKFWINRGLPDSLFTPSLQKLDLTKPVAVEVYEDPNEWNKKRKEEKNTYSFIGSNSQLSTNPFGYVIPTDNRVVITNSDRKLERERMYYIFD